MTLKNNRTALLCYFKIYASFHSHRLIQTGVRVRKRQIRDKISHFLSLVTSKFDGWPWRATLLWYFKLCASFHKHRWIQTGVRVRKRQIRVKIGHFLSCVTLKFGRWPWKTIGHLSYATSSFVYHFIAIGQFKLELQSGNPKFGSKSAIFVLCDLEIWQMTLKIYRAPLLCYFKLCASFHSHGSFQAGVRVRKPQIRVKISDFLCRVTLKFDRWPWKTIGHLFYAAWICVHDFIAICEFKLELQSGNAKFGSKSAIFCPVWPWNLTDDLEKQ